MSTLLDLPRPAQYAGAPCLEMDPEVFFGGKKQVPIAKAACNECPHKQRCLDDQVALERDTPDQHIFGVFGGMTAGERKLARKEAGKPRRPPRTVSDARRRLKNSRGSSYERRARKAWLLESKVPSLGPDRTMCYRCGKNLVYETMMVARKDPERGYQRDNIRASCSLCVHDYSPIKRPPGRRRSARPAA